MQDLFTSYHILLSRNGLKWLIEDTPEVAVDHVLSAIRPQSLHDRLAADLYFAKYELRKDFQGFLKHSIRLAEAFQIVDSGPTSKNNDGCGGNGRNGGHNGGRGGSRDGGPGRGWGARRSGSGNQGGGNSANETDGKNDEIPLFLWEPHKRKGLRHLLRDCRQCPPEEKKVLYTKLAEEKMRDGPSRSTR